MSRKPKSFRLRRTIDHGLPPDSVAKSVTESIPSTDVDDDDFVPPSLGIPLPPGRLVTAPVSPEEDGMRFDKWLADAVPEMSRSRLKALIDSGQVTLDDVTIEDASLRVKPGQVASVIVPEAIGADPLPQAIPLSIIYEDDHLIVIDKPVGMVVHPAPGSPDGTLVNALLHHCGSSLSGIGGVKRPGIVHRIDKDTSGLLVVAKNDAAHQHLSHQFQERTMERAYWALVWDTPMPRSGIVEGNIGRSPSNRQKMAVVKRGGKVAMTRYTTLRKYLDGALALIECRLATGRTHQIRVHMAHIGHTLVGDQLYGRQTRVKGILPDIRTLLQEFPRQALHAYLLGFTHPITGEALRFTSPMPEDLDTLVKSLSGPESHTDEMTSENPDNPSSS